MTLIKQLIIYKYCTLGGVEKCLLSRAFLYKKINFPVMIYVYFMVENKEAITAFKNYINQHQLSNNLAVVYREEVNRFNYDSISSIDTPEVFDWFDQLNVECHTGYACNRKYLNSLPDHVDKIIVPSKPFGEFLLKGHSIDDKKLVVLPNFIIKEPCEVPVAKTWKKKIVFYYGRLDSLKNYLELIQIFEECKKQSSDFLFYIMSPSIVELHHVLAMGSKIKNDLILINSISYTKITSFLALMKHHEGIYVSASKMESFGLASGEALVHGIPSVLSDNPVHRYIVQDKPEFLYPLGKPREAAQKIIHLAKHYQSMQPSDEFLTIELANEHINQATRMFGL